MRNEILDNLEYDPDQGQLSYRGVRYFLVRPETVGQLHKDIEGVLGAERAGQILYSAGMAGGTLSAMAYRDKLGLSGQEIVDFMANMGAQIGWGRLVVDECDVEAGKLELRVLNSVFALGYGPAAGPICHMVRGVFAGVGSVVFGGQVESREVECRATGEPHCRIVVTRL